MKKSLVLMVIVALVYSIIALMAVGCAKTTPTEIPETSTVTPTIVVNDPALAWWDMSDSLFYVQINKTEGGEVVADTASLWITACTVSGTDSSMVVTPYHTEYFGYKSGDWSWILNDSLCLFRDADAIKLELTWWIGAGPKQTVDLIATVRAGAK